ncbi:MAG: hypothetical protein HUK24_08480 [Sphaerochaetaceae bacterium]|nr:hypothetical protein [Sphaerochaetaceae bacterium]
METTKNRNEVVTLLFAIGAGVIISRFSFGTLLFTLPVLFVSSKVEKKGLCEIALLLLALVFFAIELVNYYPIREEMVFGLEIYSWFFPFFILIGSGIWIWYRESTSMLRKLFVACLPVLLGGIAMGLWMSSSYGVEVVQYLCEIMDTVLSSLGFSDTAFVQIAIGAMTSMFGYIGMIFTAFPLILLEVATKSHDSQWQEDFAYNKLPNPFFYVFIGLWVLVLLYALIGLPLWIGIISINGAVGVSLLYGFQGVSILVALLRRKTFVKANSVLLLVLLMCLLPGLNIAIFITLPILGVLENWINFR